MNIKDKFHLSYNLLSDASVNPTSSDLQRFLLVSKEEVKIILVEEHFEMLQHFLS